MEELTDSRTPAHGASELDGAAILADLQRPDDLTRRFNPLGFGGLLTPDDAARFQTATVARAVLAEGIPVDLRAHIARARRVHQYGVLEYDLFSVAEQYALLVLEGALRLRFLSFYEREGVPIVSPKGAEENLAPTSFDDVRAARSRGYRLGTAERSAELPIGSTQLFGWARREGLLPGTRTRAVDEALSALRNAAAHPISHTVVTSVESARTICDAAEIINMLWGHNTPDGRLFPGPLLRRPHVIALSPDGTRAIELRLDQLASLEDEELTWHYTVFLAVEGERLIDIGIEIAHRPGFQTTVFPCEKLWEGSWSELIAAIESDAFQDSVDCVSHLDRLFFVRRDESGVDLARSAADVLALDHPPDGVWFAVIADSPFDAYAHVRDHEDIGPDDDICPGCYVRIAGRFESGADAAAFAAASAS